MSIYKFIVIFFTFFIASLKSFAQEKWLELTAGVAMSTPYSKGSSWNYQARLLPHAGVTGFFSLNKTFAIKTGLLYQKKGMITNAEYVPDTTYQYERFVAKNDYHFISIPLQLAITLGKHSRDQYRIAAGMSYGFLANGNTTIVIDSYIDDYNKKRRTVTYNHLIAATPKDDKKELPHHVGTPLNLFVPAVRLDATYQWQERFLLSFFYEYNLQDIRMRSFNNHKLYLQYAGIALGIKF